MGEGCWRHGPAVAGPGREAGFVDGEVLDREGEGEVVESRGEELGAGLVVEEEGGRGGLGDCPVGAHAFDVDGLRWLFRILEWDPCAVVVVVAMDVLPVFPPVGVNLVSKFAGER